MDTIDLLCTLTPETAMSVPQSILAFALGFLIAATFALTRPRAETSISMPARPASAYAQVEQGEDDWMDDLVRLLEEMNRQGGMRRVLCNLEPLTPGCELLPSR